MLAENHDLHGMLPCRWGDEMQHWISFLDARRDGGGKIKPAPHRRASLNMDDVEAALLAKSVSEAVHEDLESNSYNDSSDQFEEEDVLEFQEEDVLELSDDCESEVEDCRESYRASVMARAAQVCEAGVM